MDKKLVILLSGKLSSGKNTLADILKEELEKKYKESVVIDAFARPLKEMCRDIFRPLVDHLNEIYLNLLKEPKLNGYSFKEVQSWITHDKNFFEEKTPVSRILLQLTGTDIFRNHVHKDYWVELFKKNVLGRKENITICSDLRFPGEIEYLKFMGDINVITIRVERNIVRNDSFNEHVSETALDDYDGFDIIVRNDGTIDDLKEEVQKLVSKEYDIYESPGRNIFKIYIE